MCPRSRQGWLKTIMMRTICAAAIAAVLMLTAGSSTRASSQIVLEVDAERDITINGQNAGDLAGVRIDTGDLNDDGVDDLIIGVRESDPGGRLNAGLTQVLFGPLEPGTIELATGAGLTVNGIDAGDRSGVGVGSGDINHDGVDDLMIGAITADPEGRSNAGETYVIFGPLAAGTLELSDSADVTISGTSVGDQLGCDAAGSDVNGDGTDDLIVGVRAANPGGRPQAGQALVFLGPLAAGDLEASEAQIRLNGAARGDRAGCGVAGGDVSGDGVSDVVVGAWDADPTGKPGAGTAYVLLGPLAPGSRELAAADVLVTGANAGDHLGVGAAIEDVNEDGVKDLMLGASADDPHRKSYAGRAYVLLGPLSGGALDAGIEADIVINGVEAGDMLGIGVAAGDLNDDGLPDMAFGAFRADPDASREQAGETYVLFGGGP